MFCPSCNRDSRELLYRCDICGVMWVRDHKSLVYRNSNEFFEYFTILLHELDRAELDARRVISILTAHQSRAAKIIIIKWVDALRHARAQLIAVRPTQSLMVNDLSGRDELAEVHLLVLEALHYEDVREMRIRLQRGGPSEVVMTAEALQERM